ncbi:MYG1 family protein [Rubritalea tangerina]|uniref:MYG1 family protein n=1 Tax=Rubritalea tangerina TaxID=430798 RepID=A0ABW4ZDA6_9BACT
MKSILTHPGGAHKDDFLACSLMIARYGCEVIRREPSESDLEDCEVAVLDVGGEHDPEKMNFDHHQFDRDHPPTCALSLVLQFMGLYEDARQYCDWLETSEWLDTRGAVKTAQWLEVDRSAMAKLNSPIDITLLRRFAAQERHCTGEPVYEVMRMIGEDMIAFIEGMRERMLEIEAQSEVWELEPGFSALFLRRTEPLPAEPSAGLGRYIEMKQLGCVAMVYPDRRGEGYGLTRFNDDLRLDFTKISEWEDVHFAHKAGFVAKTTATDAERLQEMLVAAWCSDVSKS